MSASKRNVAIIQARMGSTRLPGKVLMELGGKTILRHVIERCHAIPGISDVCCAIPDTRHSDPIEEEARRCGALVSRGDELDVLARYYKAATDVQADTIIRITSDCPLTDPYVSGQVLALLLDGDYDYACNNMPPSYPHGLDSEAFTFDALSRAHHEAAEHEREHVTTWLRHSPSIKRASLQGPGGEMMDMRWTLDFPEDLSFFEALFNLRADLDSILKFEQIVEFLSEHDEISKINSKHHDVSRPGITTAQTHRMPS